MLPLHVLHIVAGLPPGGGISESVPALCRYLKKDGLNITLATLKGPLSNAAQKAEQSGIRLVQFEPFWPKAAFYSMKMHLGLLDLVLDADLVHVHSHWTFPVWLGCSLALKHNKTLVMTPRGCLAPERLKISSAKKRFAGLFFDRRYLAMASLIHATSEAEAKDIRCYMSHVRKRECSNARVRNIDTANSADMDSTNKPIHSQTNAVRRVVVIPNGVDLMEFDSVSSDCVFG